MDKSNGYVALLRGINVGGHHKVPMAELSKEIKQLGFDNVTTILNSGNVIFNSCLTQEAELETVLSNRLEQFFGFPIPVLIRRSAVMLELIQHNPFAHIKVTKDTRLYISFLKEKPAQSLALPWISKDSTYQILEVREKTICSILDLSTTQTPKGMDALELLFGKHITTRNWNTIHRIADKCQ